MSTVNQNPPTDKKPGRKNRTKSAVRKKGLACNEAKKAPGLELLKQQRDLSIFLASTTDLMDGLQASLEAILQMSGLDCGGIYLFDKRGEALTLIAHQGLTEGFVRAVSRYGKESDNAFLAKAGKPIYVLHKDLSTRKVSVELREGILAIAVLPLSDGDEVIGCMNLASRSERDIPAAARLAIETTAALIGSALGRLRARDSLRESEAHLRSLMESASGFAVYRLIASEHDPTKFSVHFVSPSAKDILGIPDPMQFKSWFENMHPDDVDRIGAADRKALQSNLFNEQYRIFNPVFGEWRWIHSISSGVKDKSTGKHYVNGILFDVTSKVKLKKIIRKRQTHWDALIESARNFAIYALSVDEQNPNKLRVEYVSPATRGILGVPDPMKIDAWFEHIHPEDMDRVVEANAKAFETLKFDEQYRYYNHEAGRWCWFHAISNPVMDNGVWTGDVIGVLVDITERKTIENKLKQNEVDLKKRAENLEDAVTALNVVIENRENDKADLEEKILSNLRSTVLPYLGRLKKSKLNATQANWIDIVESNLEEIASSFSSILSAKHIGLTPIEFQVASLVKIGFTTKEIAAQMNVSPKTTCVHRSSIRKKLKIPQQVNLRSYLLSLTDT